jgi:hypothetical protein
MLISKAEFLEMIPKEKMRMNFWYAHAIVRNRYCSLMTIRGLCPAVCSECKERLLNAFQLENANNPSALLTWKLRQTVTILAEQTSAKPEYTPRVNKLGVQASENPFQAFTK